MYGTEIRSFNLNNNYKHNVGIWTIDQKFVVKDPWYRVLARELVGSYIDVPKILVIVTNK